MPNDLLTVTETAKEFLRQSGYPFARLEKAHFDEGSQRWDLRFDVSLSTPNVKTIIVDGVTGKVLSFE